MPYSQTKEVSVQTGTFSWRYPQYKGTFLKSFNYAVPPLISLSSTIRIRILSCSCIIRTYISSESSSPTNPPERAAQITLNVSTDINKQFYSIFIRFSEFFIAQNTKYKQIEQFLSTFFIYFTFVKIWRIIV